MTLTVKQAQAVSLRLQGLKGSEIAKQLKVKDATVYRWFTLPEVKAAIAALGAELEADSVDSLKELRSKSQQLVQQALTVLGTELKTAESLPEKLLVTTEILSYYRALHPVQNSAAAITAQAKVEDGAPTASVVVYIPDNGRGDSAIPKRTLVDAGNGVDFY